MSRATAVQALIDEMESCAVQFERFMRLAVSEAKRQRFDSEESFRNKANEQAVMIVARSRKLAALLLREGQEESALRLAARHVVQSAQTRGPHVSGYHTYLVPDIYILELRRQTDAVPVAALREGQEPDWIGKCPKCNRTVLNHGDLCSQCAGLREGQEPPAEKPQGPDPRYFTAKGEYLDGPHWDKDCPKGKVQVAFLGANPKLQFSPYSWKPEDHVFIEVSIDGEPWRIDIGDFEANVPGGKRRGIHINGPFNLQADKHSINAVDLFSAPAGLREGPPAPPGHAGEAPKVSQAVMDAAAQKAALFVHVPHNDGDLEHPDLAEDPPQEGMPDHCENCRAEMPVTTVHLCHACLPSAPREHAGEAPATEPEWFPIETAPRDGSWFWVKRENPPPTTHIQESVFKWDDWFKGWFAGTGWYGENQLITMRFTHWRPFQDALAASQAGTAPRVTSRHTEQCITISIMLGLAGFPEEMSIEEAVRRLIVERGELLAAHGAVPPQEQK